MMASACGRWPAKGWYWCIEGLQGLCRALRPVLWLLRLELPHQGLLQGVMD